MLLTPDELLYVARTVWIEARGEPREGKRAVFHVLANRAGRRGTDLIYEAARPWQFSGWNPGDHHREKARQLTLASSSFRHALCAVLEALDEDDTTYGSRHYHADWMNPFPDWAVGKRHVAHIGQHLFYEGIR